MVQRKSSPKKSKVKKAAIAQEDMVVDYLVRKGSKGATNFEMILNLRMCDVRKRISRINADPLSDYTIESEFETSPITGKTYKRYWAVPINSTLEDVLSERKYTRKAGKKRTGGGAR